MNTNIFLKVLFAAYECLDLFNLLNIYGIDLERRERS